MSDTGGPEDPEVARLREQLAAAEQAAELRAALNAAREELASITAAIKTENLNQPTGQGDSAIEDLRGSSNNEPAISQENIHPTETKKNSEYSAYRLRRKSAENQRRQKEELKTHRFQQRAWQRQKKHERQLFKRDLAQQRFEDRVARRKQFFLTPTGKIVSWFSLSVLVAAIVFAIFFYDSSDSPDPTFVPTRDWWSSYDLCLVPDQEGEIARVGQCGWPTIRDESRRRLVLETLPFTEAPDCPEGTYPFPDPPKQVYCVSPRN